jgi:hypothetical protein
LPEGHFESRIAQGLPNDWQAPALDHRSVGSPPRRLRLIHRAVTVSPFRTPIGVINPYVSTGITITTRTTGNGLSQE